MSTLVFNIALATLSIIVLLFSIFVGPAPINAGEALAGLFGAGDHQVASIIREVRLPRALAAWLAGACLGLSGAALQGLLRNPLADPGVLGVSSAAALGAVIALYFGFTSIAAWILPMASIIFAAIATAVLYALGGARASTVRLILIGVGISAFCGAMISLVMNLSPNPFALSDLVNWLFGSVANRDFGDIIFVAPMAIIGAVLLFWRREALSMLTLGEAAAQSLGVGLPVLRGSIIAGCALLVGASVAIAGAVGFVGIVAPHLARVAVGHDPRDVFAPSLMIGGVTLTLADLMIRIAPFDQELKLGVVAALIGAPGFILIAATTRRMTE